MVKNRILPALLSLLMLAPGADAQIPDDYKYQTFKEKFPKESFVKLNVVTYDQFDIGKEGLSITTDYHEQFLCLNENAVNLKKRSVGYDTFFPITELDAKLYYPTGGKYKTEKVKTFEDKAVIENGISFHDSYREKSFNFENIREGAVIELNMKRQAKDEYLISGRRFERHLYTDKRVYKIKCHKDIDLGLYLHNMDESDIKATEWTEGDYTYYQWELLASDKKILYGDSDYDDYHWAQIVPYIRSYKYIGAEVGVLQDTDALYKWYSSLISNVKKPEDEALKKLAQDLTANSTSEKEKVKTIYNWVQDNIKYIAFSDGYGGFIPRDPDYVLQRRFGDCKDMSCLIVHMLDELDITSHFTWVGTRSIPYVYTQLPSPVVDNHMIVTYFDSLGTPYILDATDSNLKFGRPTYSIQAKEAMVALTDSTYKIITIPILPPEENAEADSVSIQFGGSSLIGKASFTATGYQAESIHAIYSSIKSDVKKKDFLTQMLGKGSNKFAIGDYAYHWSQGTKDLLRIDYDFNIDSYVNEVGNDLYVNLNLSKQLKSYRVPDNRNVSTFFKFLFEVDKVFAFDMPANTQVAYIPEDSAFENELMAYSITYRQEDSKLIYRLNFKQKALQFGLADKENWNAGIGKLSADLDRSVNLKKTKSDE